MDNKVLVKLVIPSIDESFDIFIPINELVWHIKELMIKSVNSLLDIQLPTDSRSTLINKTTARIYKNNEIISETDIRNATELILIINN